MKVLAIMNEPSPYMDIWYRGIAKRHNLSVVYNAKSNPGHPWKSFQGFNGKFASEMSLNDLRKLVKSKDIVIAGGWIKLYTFMALIWGFWYHRTTIMTTDHPFHPNKWVTLFKKYFLYKKLDYIFCATEATCNLINETYGKIVEGKVRFFPYGINTDVEIVTTNSSGNDIKLLVATNFLPRKGHRILFEALQMLDNEPTEIKNRYHFTFIGVGVELEQCKSIAKTISIDTKFLGWVENEEYLRLMDGTDVYVHPSIEEPFGIPPVDAMCKGKVVIVCDGVMSLRGIIRQGINGFHYASPIENPKASKELMDILLKLDKSKFDEIGRKAHDDAVAKFKFTQFVDLLDSL